MATGCPKCRFLGSAVLQDGSRRCAGCGHIYQAVMQYPLPPMRNGASAAATSNTRAIFIVAASILVLVASGLVYSFIASDGDSDEPPIAPDVPARTAKSESSVLQPETRGAPQARIAPELMSGYNGSSRWWVMQYQNTGGTPISFPTIDVKYTDVNGNPATYQARSQVYWLPAGESAWIIANISRAGNGDVTLSVSDLKAPSRFQSRFVRLDARNVRLEDNPSPALKDYPFLVGDVINNSGEAVSSIRVFGIGYDFSDKPCAFTSGYAKATKLADGGTAPFKLGTGTWKTRKPSYWKAEVWASVQK